MGRIYVYEIADHVFGATYSAKAIVNAIKTICKEYKIKAKHSTASKHRSDLLKWIEKHMKNNDIIIIGVFDEWEYDSAITAIRDSKDTEFITKVIKEIFNVKLIKEYDSLEKLKKDIEAHEVTLLIMD